MKHVLTLAGSDPSGGAGLQGDLKVFTRLGAYGLAVPTALTIQNTRGVERVEPIAPELVRDQLEALLTDIRVDAAKTGMLANHEVVEAVLDCLERHPIPILVVDPVLSAKNGTALLTEAGQRALRALIARARLVTPNLPEAALLTGLALDNPTQVHKAAERLHDWGAQAVLIKGGHGSGDALDWLFDGREFFSFSAPRCDNPHTHGTGCALSAALAVYLAEGLTLPAAVEKAKAFVLQAIRAGFPLGQGIGPINPLAAEG